MKNAISRSFPNNSRIYEKTTIQKVYFLLGINEPESRRKCVNSIVLKEIVSVNIFILCGRVKREKDEMNEMQGLFYISIRCSEFLHRSNVAVYYYIHILLLMIFFCV
jgi:hypothetical protein